MIPPKANWIIAGINIIAIDAIGSLSEVSAAGAGLTKTTSPPMMIKMPEMIIMTPNPFEGSFLEMKNAIILGLEVIPKRKDVSREFIRRRLTIFKRIRLSRLLYSLQGGKKSPITTKINLQTIGFPNLPFENRPV